MTSASKPSLAATSAEIIPVSLMGHAVAEVGPSQMLQAVGGTGHPLARRTGTAQPSSSRLPQDIAVNPKAPKPLSLARPIGLSPTQNAAMQGDIRQWKAQGAKDFRVNQHQVNAAGERVGVNRPDLQFTFGGKRYYIEYDTPVSNRGPPHRERILANDPNGVVILKKQK